MDDENYDCSERKANGRIHIDEVYNGPNYCDETDPELEHGRPISNCAVWEQLVMVYSSRKASRNPQPIPDHIMQTLDNVKASLLVPPKGIHTNGQPIIPDQLAERWSNKEPLRVHIGKETQRQTIDRKGYKYHRKNYAQVSQDQMNDPNHPQEGDSMNLNNDMEPFEIAQFVNLHPESAEEAKALVPTLERFADKELHHYRDELHNYEDISRLHLAAMDERDRDGSGQPGAKRMRFSSLGMPMQEKSTEQAIADSMRQNNLYIETPYNQTPGSGLSGTPGRSPGTGPYGEPSPMFGIGSGPHGQIGSAGRTPMTADGEYIQTDGAPRSPGMMMPQTTPFGSAYMESPHSGIIPRSPGMMNPADSPGLSTGHSPHPASPGMGYEPMGAPRSPGMMINTSPASPGGSPGIMQTPRSPGFGYETRGTTEQSVGSPAAYSPDQVAYSPDAHGHEQSVGSPSEIGVPRSPGMIYPSTTPRSVASPNPLQMRPGSLASPAPQMTPGSHPQMTPYSLSSPAPVMTPASYASFVSPLPQMTPHSFASPSPMSQHHLTPGSIHSSPHAHALQSPNPISSPSPHPSQPTSQQQQQHQQQQQ